MKTKVESQIENNNKKMKRVQKYNKELSKHKCEPHHVVELNSFPYGDNISYDRCDGCGEMTNLKFIEV